MPVYIQLVDYVAEEHLLNLVDECERTHCYNFELIKAVKQTIVKRKSAGQVTADGAAAARVEKAACV